MLGVIVVLHKRQSFPQSNHGSFSLMHLDVILAKLILLKPDLYVDQISVRPAGVHPRGRRNALAHQRAAFAEGPPRPGLPQPPPLQAEGTGSV